MAAIIAALCVFLIGVVLSGAFVFLVRRIVDVSGLRLTTEAAACYLAIVIGLYGIFSGLVITSLWDQQRHTEENVRHEANELRAIFMLAGALPEQAGAAIEQAAIDYAKAVVYKEWPLLLAGDERVNQAHPEKDRIWRAIRTYAGQPQRADPLVESLLAHFELLSEARGNRVYDAQRSLPAYFWIILIIGSCLSIFCTLVLDPERIWGQALMTGLAGGIVCLMLFVVYDLQGSFQGYWVTAPHAFELELERMTYVEGQDAPAMHPDVPPPLAAQSASASDGGTAP